MLLLMKQLIFELYFLNMVGEYCYSLWYWGPCLYPPHYHRFNRSGVLCTCGGWCLLFSHDGRQVCMWLQAIPLFNMLKQIMRSDQSFWFRKYALKAIGKMGANLITTESTIFSFAPDAGHPNFGQLRKLLMEPSADTGLWVKLMCPQLK